MKLTTFIRAGLLGSFTGFISGFAFFWLCPIDYPYWAAIVGFPLGIVLIKYVERDLLVKGMLIVWFFSAVGLVTGMRLGGIF